MQKLSFSVIKEQTLPWITSGNYKKRNAQNQQFLSLLVKETIKNFPRNIFRPLYDSSIEKEASKNIYDRRRIALSKVSNSSYSDCPCFSSFKFFDVALSNLKAATFNLSEFV